MTALVIATAALYPGEAAERDCAPGEVHADVDGRPLTPEEKIARMDEALRDSLARFDECQAAASVSADGGSGMEGAQGGATGGGGSGGTAAAEGGDAGTAQAGGAVESVAADGVRGTEAPEETGATVQGGDKATAQAAGAVESVAADGVQGTEAPVEGGTTVHGTERPAGSEGVPSDNPDDDIPDDIPEPDNDSVLETQIRRAAKEETDPRIRAELWNEYRKYKGLPARPIPDEDGGSSDAHESE